MSDLIDDNPEQSALIDRLTQQLHLQDLGMNKAQIIILELEIAVKRAEALRQKALDMLLNGTVVMDALAARYNQVLDRAREAERKLAVRDELDNLDQFEVPA